MAGASLRNSAAWAAVSLMLLTPAHDTPAPFHALSIAPALLHRHGHAWPARQLLQSLDEWSSAADWGFTTFLVGDGSPGLQLHYKGETCAVVRAQQSSCLPEAHA